MLQFAAACVDGFVASAVHPKRTIIILLRYLLWIFSFFSLPFAAGDRVFTYERYRKGTPAVGRWVRKAGFIFRLIVLQTIEGVGGSGGGVGSGSGSGAAGSRIDVDIKTVFPRGPVTVRRNVDNAARRLTT